MKCVSYEYEFESDLATKWRALDRVVPQQPGRTKQPNTQKKNRQAKKKQEPMSDYSQAKGDIPAGASRDHLSRKVRREKCVSANGDSASVGAPDSDGSLDEDEDDSFHDAREASGQE